MERTHKAVIVATNELEIPRLETTVTLHTWGPACGEEWVPGTQLDRRDERVTCAACAEVGKPPVTRHRAKHIAGALYGAACDVALDERARLVHEGGYLEMVNCEACLAKKEEV